MEVKVAMPIFAYQDYPVEIKIRIYGLGNRYGVHLFATDQYLQLPMELSEYDSHHYDIGILCFVNFGQYKGFSCWTRSDAIAVDFAGASHCRRYRQHL